MPRYDKLGRRIPDFDRSAANKKSAATRLAKDPEAFSKMGKAARSKTGRGYFGKLKEENPEALKQLSKEGVEKRARKVQPGIRGAEE